MPLHNNSFSVDSESERLERLRAIQDNRAATLPLITGIHADVQDWMQDCYTAYNTLLQNARANSNDVHSKTVQRRIAKSNLRQELMIAKKQILGGYGNDDIRRRAFGIEGALPTDADEMLRLAREVERLTAKHKTEGIVYHISDIQISHLHAADEALRTAQTHGTESSAEEDTARATEERRFNDDSAMLQRLLGDWQAILGTNDPRIGLIGMVNTRKGGNSGRPGVPSLVIDPESLDLVILPDAEHPAATSYQTEFRESGHNAEWELFANSSETRVPTAVALIQGNTAYEFHTRARNSHGYSDWSTVIVRNG